MGAALQRVKADIKDFDPAGVPSLASGQPWVAMGKHLCGAATDFTLRCVVRSAAAKSPGAGEGLPKVDSNGVPQSSGAAAPCAGTSCSGADQVHLSGNYVDCAVCILCCKAIRACISTALALLTLSKSCRIL